MMMMKTCTKCKEEKSIGLFYKDKNRADGHMYWCKACVYTPNGRPTGDGKPHGGGRPYLNGISKAKNKHSRAHNARKNHKRRAVECPNWHYRLALLTSDTCVK